MCVTKIQVIMKKLLFLLLAMPFILVSCSDDDDLPNVNFTVNYENAVDVDGILYVVQGDTLAFTGIYVTPVNEHHKAVIGGASYSWDFIPAGVTIVEPFGREFLTALYAEGPHEVQISCSVYEVDCTPATAILTFPVVIVGSADEIPQPSVPGDGTLEPKATIKEL